MINELKKLVKNLDELVKLMKDLVEAVRDLNIMIGSMTGYTVAYKKEIK